MFHCNGWCYPLVGDRHGRHARLPARGRAQAQSFELIVEHGVTHMCGAPTVLGMLIAAAEEERRKFRTSRCTSMTGGSPPPAKVIQAMEELGFQVLHIYGMTELQGPFDVLRAAETGRTSTTEMARQGVRYPVVDGHIVGDPKTASRCPRTARRSARSWCAATR